MGSKKEAEKTATIGVLDYLQTVLPRRSLLDLYQEPLSRYVCRAVLQQVSPVAQQVVMRLSCTGGSFPLVDGVQVWTRLPPSQQNEMFRELYQWAILQQDYSSPSLVSASSPSPLMVALTPEFEKCLHESMRSRESSPWTPLTTLQVQALEQEAREKAVTVTTLDLEQYTQQQWDAVLHFLVGTVGKAEPPPAVVHFLMQTGLMQPDPEYVGKNPEDAPVVITQKGYDFMLQDNNAQVWHFVVQYLKSLESHKKGAELRKEALLLLICLSFARVGEAYLASSLSKDSRVMVKDLALFGLLYTRKIGKATIFYPTRVAMQLVGAERAALDTAALWSFTSKALEAALAHPQPHNSSHLAIIVQTNFQLCAYTTSELHVSMLGLFCDVQTIRRLPNVVFMTITRDSVKSAFALGIQARQILRFLQKHAHPKLRTNSAGPVPTNVVDQIWLWDRERSRVTFTEVYQHPCSMDGEFDAVYHYAIDRDALAWSSEQQKLLLIEYKYVERIQAFVRQWRAKRVSRNT